MSIQVSPYQNLFVVLAELRKRVARFRRVALHMHSPDSYDWNKTGDKTLNDQGKLLAVGGETEFVDALKEHFDLVCITEHMKCSYASRVSNASRRETDFLILPGMEVNIQPEAAISSSRLHILAVFPEGSTAEGFSCLFAKLKDIPDDVRRTGKEVVTGLSRIYVSLGIIMMSNGRLPCKRIACFLRQNIISRYGAAIGSIRNLME